MKTLLVFLLSVPLLCMTGPSVAQDDSSKNSDQLLREALQAAERGNPDLAKDRIGDVLKHEPNNYRALVLRGQLQVNAYGAALETLSTLDVERDFLQAAMAQPQRPEAYLCLADLYYKRGYVDRGDQYMRMAQRVDPHSYQAVSLLGQRLEDSGNYAGAMDLYDRALHKFPFDHNFIQRRFAAASRGGLQPKWTTRIPSGDTGKEGAQASSGKEAAQVWSVFMDKYPDSFLLELYAEEAGSPVGPPEPYSLPFFSFGNCPDDDPSSNSSHEDLYQAVIQASVDENTDYKSLRAELDRIRTEAVKKVEAVEGGNREKSKALYDFLKSRLFREYDQEGGEFVSEVLTRNKYITVNAAALYALIAHEAKLPVSPVIHRVYMGASTNDGKRSIPIEFASGGRTGLSVDQAFDVSWADRFKVWASQPGEPGLLHFQSSRMVGEASKEVAAAYQFANAATIGLNRQADDPQIKSDSEQLAKLREELLLKLRQRKAELDRAEARHRNEPELKEEELSKVHSKFERELGGLKKQVRDIEAQIRMREVDYLARKGLTLLRSARALSPATEEFSARIEDTYLFLGRHDVQTVIQDVSEKMEKRRLLERDLNLRKTELEAAKKMSSGGALREVIETVIEGKKQEIAGLSAANPGTWAEERKLWLKALERTAAGLSELRCSAALKRRMESLCWASLKEARRNGQEEDMKNEIEDRYRAQLQGTEFARKYFGEVLGGE